MGGSWKYEVVWTQLVNVFQSLHLWSVNDHPAIAWQSDEVVNNVRELYCLVSEANLGGFPKVHVAVLVVMLLNLALAFPQLENILKFHSLN